MDDPAWGELRVRCIEAEYDEEYLAGPPRTYCKLLLLETFKWRRRQHKTACKGLQPRWNDEFLFEDVCANSKLTVDVWNAADDPEEFLGKATIPLADVVPARGGAPKAQVVPWFELMPGRVRLELRWTPYVDTERTLLDTPVMLTADEGGAPPPSPLPTGAPAPPPKSVASPAIARVQATSAVGTAAAIGSPGSPMETRMEEPAMPVRPGTAKPTPAKAPEVTLPQKMPQKSPQKSPRTVARGQLKAQEQAYDDDDFEDDFEDDEELMEEETTTPPAPAPPAPARAPPAPAPAPPAPAPAKAPTPAATPPPPAPARFRPPEFIEYTDRGGSGKENQDAYFVHRFDEKNAVLGVFDGHGPDHGKVAAWAAARAVKNFLIEHFTALATDPEGTMTRCFEHAHKSVFQAISSQPGVRVHQGLLVIDVDEEDWPLGYDAADGGTTASVAALLDGRTLVYAAAGDSCSVLGVPSGKGGGPAAKKVTELVPEHSPTNMHDWVTYLQGTGVHCVFDHEAMFDNQPHNLLPIFTPTPDGGWEIAQSTMDKTKELGVGLKTARGDLAAVIMTPESGKFSQMMLGVTRSVGDFYHQTYGVTWRPEVVVKDLYAECMANDHSDGAVLIVASDGVWDHWTFDGCMEELLLPDAGPPGQPLTTAKRTRAFFEKTRDMGEEAFGEGADNLTGVVVILPRPPPPPPTAPTRAGVTREEFGA